MNGCPRNEKCRPLPLRREFWRTLPDVIRKGTVLGAETMLDREDVRNAAQSILIDHIEPRLMTGFERPVLADNEFYAAFFSAYTAYIRATELLIWEEIGREVDDALRERPDRELTEKEAAFMTIAFLGHPEPPQSIELYINLAAFGRVYEELLIEKYGSVYEPEVFYSGLREHMPRFLLRLIAMDSATSMLLTANAVSGEFPRQGETILKSGTVLNPGFFILEEDESFWFFEKFLDAVSAHMKKEGICEDGVGRTEDRGCPVLYAAERKNVIMFAVNELIEQHRAWFAVP